MTIAEITYELVTFEPAPHAAIEASDYNEEFKAVLHAEVASYGIGRDVEKSYLAGEQWAVENVVCARNKASKAKVEI